MMQSISFGMSITYSKNARMDCSEGVFQRRKEEKSYGIVMVPAMEAILEEKEPQQKSCTASSFGPPSSKIHES